MKFFEIKHPHFPWGDYGHVLVAGEARCADDDEEEMGPLFVCRTGPFIPPITFPFGHIIVTDALRQQLENSGLNAQFGPVIKKKVVNIAWQTWDRTKPEPEFYPGSGEPEHYLRRKHDPASAEALGTLWELMVPFACDGKKVQRKRRDYDPKNRYHQMSPWEDDIVIVSETWKGGDFFKAKPYGCQFVSERAKAWLEQRVSDWTTFTEAPTC